MKHKYSVYTCTGLFILLFTGCQLNQAPECVIGHEKCDTSEILGSGVYSICDTSGRWEAVMGCLSCNQNQCSDDSSYIACDTEDETNCLEVHDFSIQFTCYQHKWIPYLCSGTCDGNVCSRSTNHCENGSTQCYWIDSLDSAIQLVCEDQRWITLFCPDHIKCDGNVCAKAPEPDHSCESGFADCNHNESDGCETNLNDKHMKSCTECANNYGNCDNDLSNGCEFDLKAAGLTRCGGCDNDKCYYENSCVNAMTTTEACGTDCIDCTQLPNVNTAACESGNCIISSCAASYQLCDNKCMDLSADAQNCGSCGYKCADHPIETAASNSCLNNQCQYTCNSGYTQCSETNDKDNIVCIKNEDMQTSPSHCGKCNNACKTNETCVDGTCEATNVCASIDKTNVKKFTITTSSGTKEVTAVALNSINEISCLSDTSTDISYDSNHAFYLTSDITISSDDWTPIGTKSKPFTGALIGNGHTIKTTTPLAATQLFGLFGYLNGAYIGNLKLDMTISYPYGGTANVGAIAGQANNSYIENISGSVSMACSGTSQNVGGIVGSATKSTLSNCNLNNVTMELGSSVNVGGIVGDISETTLKNVSIENGDVNGRYNLGGIVGYMIKGSKIIGATFNGDVYGKNSSPQMGVGGIVGTVGQDNDICTISNAVSGGGTVQSPTNTGGIVGTLLLGEVTNSHSSMNIVGYSMLGGIAGYCGYKISNSYATGNIDADVMIFGETDYKEGIGGIAGLADYVIDINNCYYTGTIQADDHDCIGGIIGNATTTGSSAITDCYSFGKVTGNNKVGGFIGNIAPRDSGSATLSISRCGALNQVKAVSDTQGGFAGMVDCSYCDKNKTVIDKSFSLVLPSGSVSNSGGFVGSTGESLVKANNTITNSYYHKDYTPAVGSGDSRITLTSLSTAYFKSNKAQVSDSQTLGAALGTSTSKSCTMNIGEGSKTYTIPISSGIYPDFCL